MKRDLKSAGFRTELVKANVRGLEKLVRRLSLGARGDGVDRVRSRRRPTRRPTRSARQRSSARQRRPAAAGSSGISGANDGRFTRIAAEHADYAVALDADGAVIERLYRALRDEGSTSILPLVANIADPPPGLGWRGRERRPLPDRGRPDLTLALAVVHHLAIGANVPLAELVDWLAELETELVIEFPTAADPMVDRMLAVSARARTPTTRARPSSACSARRSRS